MKSTDRVASETGCRDFHDSRILAETLASVLMEKKGKDVRLYDMRGKTSVTDFYINVSASSQTQVRALADAIDEQMTKYSVPPRRIEGKSGGTWILVDFTDVIVNIFDRPTRAFYDLDRHFATGECVDLSAVEEALNRRLGVQQTD